MGFAGAVSGMYTASAVHSGNAEAASNRIVDYNRCPHCGSIDVRTLSKEEWTTEQAKATQSGVPASTISAADELKKFKELLDSGVITQEEFDAKKKQLLGLNQKRGAALFRAVPLFYTVCVKKTSPPKSASRSRASWARPSSSNRPKAVGPVPLMLAPNAPH